MNELHRAASAMPDAQDVLVVIPLEFAGGPLLAPLLEILANLDFRREVAALPGYDVSIMGRVIMEE